MPIDPADPLSLHPATAAIAQAGEHERRLGVLERRQFDPHEWGIELEPSRTVGAFGEPAFGTGWSAYVDPTYGTLSVQFFRTVEGIVILSGVAIAGTAQPLRIFTLPSGYRPARHVIVPSRGASDGNFNRAVQIETDGDVIGPQAAAGSALAYLDGLAFRI